MPSPVTGAEPAVSRTEQALQKLVVPETSRGRRFALLALALLLAQGSFLLALNVAANPRGEFPVHLLPALVADQPREQVDAFDALPGAPVYLVLGSSRAGEMRGFAGHVNETANLYLRGSTPEDARMLFDHAVRKGWTPQGVLLVVDQFALTDVFTPRIPRSSAYGAITGKGNEAFRLVQFAVQSLDVSYVGDTLHSLDLRFITGYPPPRSNGPNPLLLQGDPETAYREGRFRPGDMDPAADRQFERAFGGNSTLAPAHGEAIRGLVAAARSRGTEVWLVIPPFQPQALEDLRARFEHVEERSGEVRQLLQGLCGPGVHAFDKTLIASFDGEPLEFYDQGHVTSRNAGLLLASVAHGDGDLCTPEPLGKG